MGTSTAFSGGKNSNPLIPSWLKEEFQRDISTDPSLKSDTIIEKVAFISPESFEQNSIFFPDDKRFLIARRNFTSFIKSGGTDHKSMARAISSYVSKTAGSAKKAASRMVPEKKAGARLANILIQARDKGIREAVKSLNLHMLANRSIFEIYAALVDVICGPGGDLDSSIARSAYEETIVEVLDMEITDLEQPSLDTLTIIMNHFVTNTIFNRIINDIGMKIILLPESIKIVQDIEAQMKDFIRGAVSDALFSIGKVFVAENLKSKIDSLYEQSFSVLHALAQQEADL